MKQDAKLAHNRDTRSRLQPISGRHNPRLKELRQAFRRGELTPAGECAIEGVKLVEEAIRASQRLTRAVLQRIGSTAGRKATATNRAKVEISSCRTRSSTRPSPAIPRKALPPW